MSQTDGKKKEKKQTQIIINNLKDITHFIHETCT